MTDHHDEATVRRVAEAIAEEMPATTEAHAFWMIHGPDMARAALAAAGAREAAPADPEGMTAVPTSALRLLACSKHGSDELEDVISELASVLAAREAPPTAAESAFLGREVEVVLGEEEGVPVVAKGVLLGFDEGGGAVLRDEMGLVHWTWPRLDVRLAGEG